MRTMQATMASNYERQTATFALAVDGVGQTKSHISHVYIPLPMPSVVCRDKTWKTLSIVFADTVYTVHSARCALCILCIEIEWMDKNNDGFSFATSPLSCFVSFHVCHDESPSIFARIHFVLHKQTLLLLIVLRCAWHGHATVNHWKFHRLELPVLVHALLNSLRDNDDVPTAALIHSSHAMPDRKRTWKNRRNDRRRCRQRCVNFSINFLLHLESRKRKSKTNCYRLAFEHTMARR